MQKFEDDWIGLSSIEYDTEETNTNLIPSYDWWMWLFLNCFQPNFQLSIFKKTKLYGPFFMDGVQLPQG